MSYSNFGKQHNGRGLKAFVICVCVLLVVAIVASALVLWRTTNHYTELPEFDDEDGEEFSITDDEEFNEDPYSDESFGDDDDEPDLSGGHLDVEYDSFTGSGLSFEVSPLSSAVSSYSSPISTASVKVTASFDLSKVNHEWFFEADEEDFYYDDVWHDVSGEVFSDDYGNNIDSYLKISDDTFDSCVVEFWDYFPATTYLYYHCWNSTGDVYGRVLVDCLYKEDVDSVFLYIGDLSPSFSFDYDGLYDHYFAEIEHSGLDSPHFYNCVYADITSYLRLDDFCAYYDGAGNFYNVSYLGEIFYPNGFSDFCNLEFTDLICRFSDSGDIEIPFLSTYCHFYGTLNPFTELCNSSGCFSSLNFAPVCGSYYYLSDALFSDYVVWSALCCVFNDFGTAILPHLVVSHIGSFYDSDLSSAYCFYPEYFYTLESTYYHYPSYLSVGTDYYRDLCSVPLSSFEVPYDYDKYKRTYSGLAVDLEDLCNSITGDSFTFNTFEDVFSGFCSLHLDDFDPLYDFCFLSGFSDLFLEVELDDPSSSYYLYFDFYVTDEYWLDCFYY